MTHLDHSTINFAGASRADHIGGGPKQRTGGLLRI
jgi:hypothetical protein